MKRSWLSCAVALALGSWASAAAAHPLKELSLPDVTLPGSDGTARALTAQLTKARVTVLIFFSRNCDCQRAHDALLGELARTYAARGAQFFAIDSEAGSSLQLDTQEASARHYPFPVLRDEKGLLAQAFEAQFATTTVVLDARGQVHYRGGIDSSRKGDGANTRPFLRDALEALTHGQEPQVTEPKALGCYLRKA